MASSCEGSHVSDRNLRETASCRTQHEAADSCRQKAHAAGSSRVMRHRGSSSLRQTVRHRLASSACLLIRRRRSLPPTCGGLWQAPLSCQPVARQGTMPCLPCLACRQPVLRPAAILGVLTGSDHVVRYILEKARLKVQVGCSHCSAPPSPA